GLVGIIAISQRSARHNKTAPFKKSRVRQLSASKKVIIVRAGDMSALGHWRTSQHWRAVHASSYIRDSNGQFHLPRVAEFFCCVQWLEIAHVRSGQGARNLALTWLPAVWLGLLLDCLRLGSGARQLRLSESCALSGAGQ